MSRFVQRDGLGRIIGSFARLQPGYAEEELADDSAELVDFMANGVTPTAAEIDAAKTVTIDVLQNGATKALATALFQTINDVRVLKGQATITAVQFRAYLKSLI